MRTFRMTGLSICAHSESRRGSALELVALASADLLEKNREDDESADEGTLPIGVDAGHQEAVADHLDQRGADEGAISTALAAHEVRAPDHGRGDHLQLVARPERVDRRA